MDYTVVASTQRGPLLLRRIRVTFEDELREAGGPFEATAYLSRLVSEAPGCFFIINSEPVASQIVSLGIYHDSELLRAGRFDGEAAFAIINTSIRFPSAEEAARYVAMAEETSRRREEETEDEKEVEGEIGIFRDFVDGSGFLSRLEGDGEICPDPDDPAGEG